LLLLRLELLLLPILELLLLLRLELLLLLLRLELLLLGYNSIFPVKLLLNGNGKHLRVEAEELFDGEPLNLRWIREELVVSISLLILSQDGELVEEKLLLFLWQTIEKLLRPLLGLLRSCLLRLELLLLRLELLLLSRLRLLLLLWPERLPCLLLRLKLLLGVKLSLKLLLLLRSELLLLSRVKLLLLLRIELLSLLLRLEALVLRLELLLRARLILLEAPTIVRLCTEWLETLLPELALLQQSQLLTGSEDKPLLAFEVADQDATLLS